MTASPKATVPVLVIEYPEAKSEVIDESLDIMLWALAQNDPDGWLDIDLQLCSELIDANDDQFKPWLDRYKYPDRYEDLEAGEPLQHCEVFLARLEERLQSSKFLVRDSVSLADMAIYSFVRQFAFVDIDWFRGSQYRQVNRWLAEFLDGELFASVMAKYPQWHAGETEPLF